MIYTDGMHLISDEGTEELHRFCEWIFFNSSGVKKARFRIGRCRPHYFLNKRMNDYALRFGAIPITTRELVRLLRLNYQLPTNERDAIEFEVYHRFDMDKMKPISKGRWEQMLNNIINGRKAD